MKPLRGLARHAGALAFSLAANAALLVVLTALTEAVPPAAARPEPELRAVAAPEPPRRKREARQTPRRLEPPPAPRLPELSLPSVIGAAPAAESPAEPGDRLRPSLAQAGLSAGAELVLTEELVDQPPRPTLQPPASYPLAAQEAQIEGEVRLRVLVGTDGLVEHAVVESAQPAGVFEGAALQAIERWRFTPASFQGRPVQVWCRQTMRFSLH